MLAFSNGGKRKTRHRKNKSRTSKNQRGAGLSEVLPTTTWGQWANFPGALAWSANSQAPAPLANGGLYTGPQSTGSWASSPFPATQYAESVEAAKISGNPDVFYHQRPNDNQGASFSPYVGTAISDKHYSATSGGKRRNTRSNKKSRSRKSRNNRR